MGLGASHSVLSLQPQPEASSVGSLIAFCGFAPAVPAAPEATFPTCLQHPVSLAFHWVYGCSPAQVFALLQQPCLRLQNLVGQVSIVVTPQGTFDLPEPPGGLELGQG